MADVWKSIRTLVSILLYCAPILCYSICLYSKYCHIIESYARTTISVTSAGLSPRRDSVSLRSFL
jgi:hypothetical protein